MTDIWWWWRYRILDKKVAIWNRHFYNCSLALIQSHFSLKIWNSMRNCTIVISLYLRSGRNWIQCVCFSPMKLTNVAVLFCRFQWPHGLKRRSTAARLMRLWVRIPPGTWMSVWCECCVLSGRGLCDKLVTRPGGSYRLWCVVVCDLKHRECGDPGPLGNVAPKEKKK